MIQLNVHDVLHHIYSYLASSKQNVIAFAGVNAQFRSIVKSCSPQFVKTTFKFQISPPPPEKRKDREEFPSSVAYKQYCYNRQIKEPFEYRKELEGIGELFQLFTKYYFEHCKLTNIQWNEIFNSPILNCLTFKKSDFIPSQIPENSKSISLKKLSLESVTPLKDVDWKVLCERLPNLEHLKLKFQYSNEILQMTQLKSLYLSNDSINNEIANKIFQTPFKNLEKLTIRSYHFNEIEMFHLPNLKVLILVHTMRVHRQHKMDVESVRNLFKSTRDTLEQLTLDFEIEESILSEIGIYSKLKQLSIEQASESCKDYFANSSLELVTCAGTVFCKFQYFKYFTKH